MSWLKDFGKYSWLVIHEWGVLITGGIIVALLWLWSTFEQVSISRKVGMALAASFLFFATFRVWLKSYRERADMQKRVDELQNNLDELTVPILKGNFTNNPIVGQFPSDRRDTELILGLTVFNTGAPTALYGFTLKTVFPDGKSFEYSPLPITVKPLEITDPNGKKRYRIETDNYLPSKAMTPVPHNGMVNGYLPYRINMKPEEFAKTSADLFVTFGDANGKPYSIQGKWTPGQK